MLVAKRTILLLLMLLTLIFMAYQSCLIFCPSLNLDTDRKYVQLVDQYQVTKMERLLLQEQFALAKTKERVLKLASLVQQNGGRPLFVLPARQAQENYLSENAITHVANLSDEQQPIALSLEQAKTYEQLEAYVSNSRPSQPPAMTNEEKNLLTADSNDFTLQLMGVRDKNELIRYVNSNKLASSHIFHTYYLNKDWYVLISGQYKNRTEALKAIESLPTAIKDLKPWIRQLSSVQKAIQMSRSGNEPEPKRG